MIGSLRASFVVLCLTSRRSRPEIETRTHKSDGMLRATHISQADLFSLSRRHGAERAGSAQQGVAWLNGANPRVPHEPVHASHRRVRKRTELLATAPSADLMWGAAGWRWLHPRQPTQ